MKILHAADLHMSQAEAEYSFEVLQAIFSIAATEGAELILLAGDIFDSYDDMCALKSRFQSQVASNTAGARLVCIPGNHEALRSKGRDAPRWESQPRLDLCVEAELRHYALKGGEVQVFCLPYGADAGLIRFEGEGLRIVLAHGSIPELSWLGPKDEAEADASVLDRAGLLAAGPHYLALGHIHEKSQTRLGEAHCAYPGSARPWRRGESGPRQVLILDYGPEGASLALSSRQISEAGEYRRVSLGLGTQGLPDWQRWEAQLDGFGGNDWVEIELNGLLRREGAQDALVEELRARLTGRFRRLDIDCDALVAMDSAELGRVGESFLRLWEEEKSGLVERYGEDASVKALELGLRAIARFRGKS